MTMLPTRDQAPRLAGAPRLPGRTAPPAPRGGMTPRDILRVLQKRKWLIQLTLVITVAVGAVATLLWQVYAPSYVASALLRVTIPSNSVLEAARFPQIGKEIMDREKRTQVALVKREDVLLAAAEDRELQRTAFYTLNKDRIIEALEEEIVASALPESEFIELRMYGRRRGDLPDVVNAVARAVASLANKPNQLETDRRIKKLDDELSRLRRQRDRIRGDIAAAQRGTDVSAISGRRTTLEYNLQLLTRDLVEATQLVTEARAGLEATLAAIEAYKKGATDGTSITDSIQVRQMLDNDVTLRTLTVQLANLQNSLANAQDRYGPEHRNVKAYQSLAAATDDQLRERQKKLTVEFIDSLTQVRQSALAITTQRRTQAETQLSQARREMRDLDETLARIDALAKEEDDVSKNINLIQVRILDMRLGLPAPDEQALEGPVVIRSLATPPRTRHMPKWGVTMPIAVILGLMLGLGLAFLLEYADASVKNPSDITRRIDLALLGMVPHGDDLEEQVEDFRRVSLQAPQSPAAEAFRRIRTNLVYSGPPEERRCLLVTSPAPEDGRTTVVMNLATSMAQAGRRVLVIDANFRQPAIADMFPAADQAGLSSVLVGQVAWRDAVSPSDLPNCQVMTAGPMPPNPSELLDLPAMEQLIREVSAEYDQVIIDGAPLMIVSDSIVLSRQVDGVILVVRAGANSVGLVQKAADQLHRVGARILGVVLQGVRATAGGYLRKNYDTFYEYHQKSLP